ncbi:MAG: hypothetical protein J2P44_02395 [Candidatus Dormibacteraeota bacterium]|nr:hypothetical protein [Candidatus Dormibacteraeota bacterium]
MRLANGKIELEIEEQHGRLTRLRHRPLDIDLIREPSLCENFRLLLPLPDWRGHYIYGRDQRLMRAEVGEDGAGATLRWSQLESSRGTFHISVTMSVRLTGDDVEFRVVVENRTRLTVEEAWYPALGGLRNWEERERWRLHRSTAVGVGMEWPVYEEFPGTYLGPREPLWFALYPAQMAMPWVDLYDAQQRRGVMVANLDPRPSGAVSMVVAQLFPAANWRGSRQCWPDPTRAGGAPVGMTLGWAAFPFVPGGQTWESPPVVLHFHPGTWYAAADHYRAWFDRTMPIPVDKRGSWLAQQDAWQSTIISYPEDTINYRFADLPRLAAAAKDAGIHVLQIDGWDQGGIDRDYPQYVPDRRLGTPDELQAAIAECRRLGVDVLLFGNLQWANIETDWWRDELHRYAVRDPRGNVRNSMGWEYHTLLGLANQCESRMVPMNPAHPEYAAAIRSQLGGAARLGARGMQIDKLGMASLGIDYDPVADGRRDDSLVNGIWTTLAAFLEDARAEVPDFALASESHWDRAIPLVDASYSRFFSEQHLPTTGYAFPEYKQSCCIVGDQDRGLVNNCLRYGHIINIEAKCLHGTAADVPGLAAYTRELLALRRRLWDVLWDGHLAEPAGFTVDAEPDLLYSLHRDAAGRRSALVLNHFARTPRQARVCLDGERAGEVSVHRPGRPAQRVAGPIELKIGPDEVVVAVWRQA